MRDTSTAEALLCSELSAVFCILFSVFYTSVSLSFAEWDWGLRPVIGGEGIVSKVRLRRHSSACAYTFAGLPGSIQALRLNIF